MKDPAFKDQIVSVLRVGIAWVVGKLVQVAIHYGLLPVDWSADTTVVIDWLAQFGGFIAVYAIARFTEKIPWLSRLLVFRNPSLPAPHNRLR